MTKVRIKHNEHEIEIEGSDGAIKNLLEDFYERIEKGTGTKLAPTSIKKQLLEEPPSAKPSGKKPTPAEYYKRRSQGKTDGLTQLLIFGKYLEDYEGVTEFSRGDINRMAKDAKFSKDIHAQYFTNGVKQGLLRKTGQRYSLTLSAEEVLAQMSS